MKTMISLVVAIAFCAPLSLASTLIPVTARVDHLYDPLGNHLLISTRSGTIERWDIDTQSLLAPIVLGGDLRKMELTTDREYVIVADATTNENGGRFRRVDLALLTVFDFEYSLDFNSDGIVNVQDLGLGLGLLRTLFFQ